MSLSYLAYRQEAVTILDNKYKVLTDCMLKPPLLTNCYSVDKMKFSKTLYFDKNTDIYVVNVASANRYQTSVAVYSSY